MDRRLNHNEESSASAAIALPLAGIRSPVDVLAQFADLPHTCLLYSAAEQHALSRYSFLAADPIATLTGSAAIWSSIRDRIRATTGNRALPFPHLPPFQGGWMGYFGYELGTAFDRVVRHCRPSSNLPDVAVALYDWVIAWDRAAGRAWLISTGIDKSGECDSQRARVRAAAVLARWESVPATTVVPATASHAATTRPGPDRSAAAYQYAVSSAIEHILAGDIFQVNLAQRFSAPFAGDPLSLSRAIFCTTQAPMAAFLQQDAGYVVSASPERFLHYDARTRRVETRPIKGTRPRDIDVARDRQLVLDLQVSEKDRAENVMIVDLLRNDLSRVCDAGSVRVPMLCALESHPTVHHLVSTVIGDLRSGLDALDLLAATFPGGSITGAPKLRAMEIITELEPVARGVYAGAIGWIGLDGAMDTSVAIRTVTISDGVVTLHAGGGITAQSNPVDEYHETLDKAAALIAAIATA